MSGYCDHCGNTLCVCSEYEAQTVEELAADEWRWGYRHGYLHGWNDDGVTSFSPGVRT